ncbi:MAG: hypothetical protein JO290_06880, partial [Sphingomonadaceae bacterium]|nr:hypothetical protein [Sphingomonadaceae bacterium]
MTTPNLRRALAALGAAFLWLAIGLVPAGGQSTRATLNAYNNTYIVANGVGAITGPILNADIGGLISSAGMLADTNAWTGANSFSQMPTLSACTGYLTGNGGSPASCSPTIPATALAAGAAAINLDRTTYARHAALTTAVAAVTTDTIEQRGYYGVGDGGWALYDWNSTSLATADGVLVILPSGQSSGTAGRYILRIPAEGVHPEVAGAYGNMPLTGVAATASWAANATTIAVPSGQGWSAGQIIYDTTTGRRIGTVASYSGTSLGVSGGGAAYASSGNADVLAIGNDDTTALQNLLNYVSNSSAAGGTIILNTKKGGTAYLIDSASVTIPNNVKLKGVGMPYFSSYSAGASVGWPMIQLNPAYSISPQEGSSAQDLLVWRAGLAPYPSTSEQLFNYQINVLCDFGGWSSATGRCSAGTSVAFNVQKRDVKLDNIMVVGFNKAVYGNQSPRLGLRHLYCDDANCFEITNVGDVYYVNDVRGQQPWTSNLTEQFSVYSATVPSGGGGTGYTVGDLLNVPSGVPGTLTCTTNAILRVSGVSSGAVTSFEVDNLNGSDTGQCARYNVAETWGLTASTLPIVWAAGSGGTNGTNVPLYLVQGAAKQTATASWTASTTITVNSCPAASSVTANVTPVLDGTPTTPSVLGLFVSCSGTTLTLSAASSGSNGDTLYFSQCNTFPALQGTISGGALSAITGVSAAGACVAQVRPNLLTSVVGGGLANAQVNGALVANANGVQVAQDYYAKNPVTLTTNHCAGSCSGAQALISMFGGAYRPGIGGYVHDTGDGAGFSDIEFEGEQTDFKLANLSFQKWRNIGGENFEGDWDLPGVGLDLEGAMSDVSLDQLEFEGNSTAYLLNNTGGATLIDLGLGFGSGQTHAAHNQGIVTGSGSSGVILGAHLNSASGYSGNGSPPPIQIGSNSGSWVIDDVMNSGSGSLTPYSAWFGVAPSAAPPTSPQLGWRLGPINVNGDFNFDQVNEGATAGANAGYRADLWRSANIGAAGVTSVRQTAGNPTGFNYNLLLTSGTPTTPGSGQSDYLYSPVEAGQTFAALQWGGSGAQQAEIEGQVKASVAGTYDL